MSQLCWGYCLEYVKTLVLCLESFIYSQHDNFKVNDYNEVFQILSQVTFVQRTNSQIEHFAKANEAWTNTLVVELHCTAVHFSLMCRLRWFWYWDLGSEVSKLVSVVDILIPTRDPDLGSEVRGCIVAPLVILVPTSGFGTRDWDGTQYRYGNAARLGFHKATIN